MRLSLRVKMIGATVLLLVFTVALFSVLQARAATADLEAETARLRDLQLRQAEELGKRTVASVASASPFLIADNDYSALARQIEPVVADARGADLRILRAVITNEKGEVLAFAAGEGGGERAPMAVDGLEVLKEPRVELGALDADGIPAAVTVTAPIRDQRDKLWGYTRFTYELTGLKTSLAAIEARALERRSAILERTATVGGLFVLLGVIVTILQSLAITRPLSVLARAAQRIAGGDLTARAPRSGGGDELAALATSFNDMADQVQTLLRDTAAKTAMEKELEVARVIQETLVPPPGLVDVGFLRFAGIFSSASLCGGDFWTWLDLQGGRIFLGVGDVTGHGVPSAMITAACKSGLQTLRSVTGGDLRVAPLMEELNKTLHEAARRRFFMTFFGLVADPVTRTLEFANAGHNFPILVHREPSGALKSRPLVARGTRLGDLPDATFTPNTAPLERGDLLCLYTDGLTEYRDPDGREFGERRLRKLLERAWSLEPDAGVQLILDDLRVFARGAIQEDDITLVLIRVAA